MFTEDHVLRSTLIFTFIFSLTTVWFRFSLGVGFLLGGAIGTLAFRLLIIDSKNLLQKYAGGLLIPAEIPRYHWKSFLKRFSLYAGALAISADNPSISFLATLGGLLLPRLAIYYHLLKGRLERGP